MTIQYTPRGVCSRSFTIQVEDGLSRPAGPGHEAGPGLTPLQKAAEPPVPVEPEAQRLLCPVIPASHTGRW